MAAPQRHFAADDSSSPAHWSHSGGDIGYSQIELDPSYDDTTPARHSRVSSLSSSSSSSNKTAQIFQTVREPHHPGIAPPEPTAKSRNGTGSLRVWTWELITAFVAIGLFAAIVTLLGANVGKPLLQGPLNLPTVVAVLTISLRTSLLFVVVEVLGQARWAWFSAKPRALADLNQFDRGSRGMYGSLGLIGLVARRRRGGGPATWAGAFALTGGLIVFISFSIGPFTQQALRTVSCTQRKDTRGQVSVPVARFAPWPNMIHLRPEAANPVSANVKAAVISGLTSPAGTPSSIRATCPTGNCTFGEYDSIGLCSSCADMSEFVVLDKTAKTLRYFDATLDYANGTSPTWMSISRDDVPRHPTQSWLSSAFVNAAPISFVNISILALSDTKCAHGANGTLQSCPHGLEVERNNVIGEKFRSLTDYVAVTCRVYPCQRTFSGEVRSGVLHETVLSSVLAPLAPAPDTSIGDTVRHWNYYTGLRLPCYYPPFGDEITSEDTVESVERKMAQYLRDADVVSGNYTDVRLYNASLTGNPHDPQFAAVPDYCVTQMAGYYGAALADFIDVSFFPPKKDGNSTRCTTAFVESDMTSVSCGNPWWLEPLFQRRNASLGSLAAAMDNFTVAVSDQLRALGAMKIDDAPWESESAGLAAMNQTGEMWETGVCTGLQWGWLAVPGGLVFATVVLLVCAVVASRGSGVGPVWKSNVLPLTFYGLRCSGGAGGEGGRKRGSSAQRQSDDMGGSGEQQPPWTPVGPPGERSAEVMDLSGIDSVGRSTMVQFRSTGPQLGFVAILGDDSERVISHGEGGFVDTIPLVNTDHMRRRRMA